MSYRPFSFSRADRDYWREAAYLCIGKEAKPAKIDFSFVARWYATLYAASHKISGRLLRPPTK
jgi:hypothetical protein